MPCLLLSIAGNDSTATMVGWLVPLAQRFVVGQARAVLEAEKGRLIIEAAKAGRHAELLIQPGQTVTVGAKLAHFEVADAGHSINSTSEQKEAAMPEGPSTSRGKVIPVLMPQAGNTMEEG